ncbi:hypothetical protein B0J13DRAFT_458888 [Dactylonectria estremocensis]|uniref:Rhodopsin domain-containing protein n=1 Tax=Dactylonectria estremocensis TaxID=1079267 RepID=A0A9P9DE03_9HYPO|nr:hypothetical protein B0J13DRAFT_458888 [Dactylonectria estremocensis]
MSAPSSPVPGTSYAAVFFVPAGVLLGLTLLTSIARFYSRWHPTRLLRWDDYTLAFALVPQLLTVAWFIIVAAMYSYGRGVVGNPEPLSIVGPLGATVGVLWFWSMNVIRISMCLMILRLKDSRRWKGPLWSLIAVQVALALSATVVNLCYCRPLSAAWESDPDAVCLKPSQMKAFAYTYNAFNIASDLILSLMPLAFIFKMHRLITEKILIGCLMAAGLLASVFGILRLVILLAKFGQDIAWMQVKTDLLCGLELMVATLAASLPCLKAPIHRVLRRLGFLHSSTTDASSSSFLARMTFGSHFRRQIGELPLADSSGGPDDKRMNIGMA